MNLYDEELFTLHLPNQQMLIQFMWRKIAYTPWRTELERRPGCEWKPDFSQLYEIYAVVKDKEECI
jgi:hypothetical protein